MATIEPDLDLISESELLSEVMRLRQGIRAHRDARGDDRCWLDDLELYKLLPEGIAAPDTSLPPEEVFLANCARFCRTRQNPSDAHAWGLTPGGGMMLALERAEAELPKLLASRRGWESLFVDDEKPNVQRVWRPYGEGRMFLHRILPCAPGEPLYHAHPWPAAVRILEGRYETRYGHGPGPEPPPMGPAHEYGAGHRYEMVNPELWHHVRPLGAPAVTFMVTGRPWKTGAPARKGRALRPLPDTVVEEILDLFRKRYPGP